ncbi:PHD zinc finger-containing protein [Reticulomyxa filosa]|uniref:PHD zinc finger-containing protein n=1 Tax=Reticulomyxa filosa TaxID=46433 RepID=X6MWS8_RETFI|nr:PHD zinc finger-containing protein [Reticulomyxa filosa]|eukprot:ETO18453.1 PHD zinc finger-containing protein [Reticulomyxa filosa]
MVVLQFARLDKLEMGNPKTPDSVQSQYSHSHSQLQKPALLKTNSQPFKAPFASSLPLKGPNGVVAASSQMSTTQISTAQISTAQMLTTRQQSDKGGSDSLAITAKKLKMAEASPSPPNIASKSPTPESNTSKTAPISSSSQLAAPSNIHSRSSSLSTFSFSGLHSFFTTFGATSVSDVNMDDGKGKDKTRGDKEGNDEDNEDEDNEDEDDEKGSKERTEKQRRHKTVSVAGKSTMTKPPMMVSMRTLSVQESDAAMKLAILPFAVQFYYDKDVEKKRKLTGPLPPPTIPRTRLFSSDDDDLSQRGSIASPLTTTIPPTTTTATTIPTMATTTTATTVGSESFFDTRTRSSSVYKRMLMESETRKRTGSIVRPMELPKPYAPPSINARGDDDLGIDNDHQPMGLASSSRRLQQQQQQQQRQRQLSTEKRNKVSFEEHDNETIGKQDEDMEYGRKASNTVLTVVTVEDDDNDNDNDNNNYRDKHKDNDKNKDKNRDEDGSQVEYEDEDTIEWVRQNEELTNEDEIEFYSSVSPVDECMPNGFHAVAMTAAAVAAAPPIVEDDESSTSSARPHPYHPPLPPPRDTVTANPTYDTFWKPTNVNPVPPNDPKKSNANASIAPKTRHFQSRTWALGTNVKFYNDMFLPTNKHTFKRRKEKGKEKKENEKEKEKEKEKTKEKTKGQEQGEEEGRGGGYSMDRIRGFFGNWAIVPTNGAPLSSSTSSMHNKQTTVDLDNNSIKHPQFSTFVKEDWLSLQPRTKFDVCQDILDVLSCHREKFEYAYSQYVLQFFKFTQDMRTEVSWKNHSHQIMLQTLWRCFMFDTRYRNMEPPSQSHEGWKEIGFQVCMGLQCMAYLAEHYPQHCNAIFGKEKSPDNYYPICTSFINLVNLICELTNASKGNSFLKKNCKTSIKGLCLHKTLVSELEMIDQAPLFKLFCTVPIELNPFQELFCSLVKTFDNVWRETKCSYMEFRFLYNAFRERVEFLLQKEPCSFSVFIQWIETDSYLYQYKTENINQKDTLNSNISFLS